MSLSHGCMTIMKMGYNFGERFQVLCLYLAKIIEKLIMVFILCRKSLDITLSICVCEQSFDET